jgi:phospho-2-dehydro-3-deoxyheptonate aldolase
MASLVAHRPQLAPGRLITAAQLRALLPPSPPLLALVRETREALGRIVARKDARLAVIVGPSAMRSKSSCASIWKSRERRSDGRA